MQAGQQGAVLSAPASPGCPEKQVLNPIFSPLPIGEPGGQGETDGAGMLGGHFPPQSPPSLVLQLSIQMGNAIPPWVSRLQGAQ